MFITWHYSFAQVSYPLFKTTMYFNFPTLCAKPMSDWVWKAGARQRFQSAYPRVPRKVLEDLKKGDIYDMLCQ